MTFFILVLINSSYENATTIKIIGNYSEDRIFLSRGGLFTQYRGSVELSLYKLEQVK